MYAFVIEGCFHYRLIILAWCTLVRIADENLIFFLFLQFFITCAKCDRLDNKHVVFGGKLAQMLPFLCLE
ncbi:hypothetical protein BS78_K317300 [Paspalum vaginatum]|uniref:PPIase cyclophilin-type domain-containing protein n=1 Tax=Paspalum vaginatum TaxID=158149 RepID=A0A9W7XD42_9POAL|nr:hypothetical protein BS78_K317300 [Paspalum vaginatum]